MLINKVFIYLSAPVFIVFLLSGPLLAHGKKPHQTDTSMSDHMQAMQELKQAIPEEYRIMQRTPIIPDGKSLQQGQTQFQQNCVVCHGDTGDGKGPAASALQTPPANFLDKKHSAIYGPGEKFWIIGQGSGKTGMPGFSQLTLADRWHLVNYILSLQTDDQDDLESLFTPE